MPKRLNSDEHIEFLRVGFKKHPLDDLVLLFNERFETKRTKAQIKSAISNNAITCGRKGGKKGSKLFNEQQVSFIKENYVLHSAEVLVGLLNDAFDSSFEVGQIRSFVKNHNIKSNRTGHFKAGEKPWNTGTKGVMKANSGCFKKGHVPVNTQPVGTEVLTNDGYISIKVAEPNHWELLQRHNWALKYGKENMPDNLRFKDGDKTNCEVSNLEPLTNAENLKLTQLGYSNTPKEIRPVLVNIAKLEVKSSEMNK